MDVLVERCAGLDVHRDSVMATVRLPGKRSRQREQHTRGFGSTIAELHALGDWLQGSCRLASNPGGDESIGLGTPRLQPQLALSARHV
jgi:hypothetical protein